MSHQASDEDRMVKCPYCFIFVEDGSRLQIHLMKCQRSNPKIKLEICEHNTTHRYPKADAKAHENTCPDRLKNLDENDSDQSWPSPPKPTTSKNGQQADADDWNDEDSGTYDAKRNAEQKNVLRNPPPFSTKSERNRFNDEERKRRSALERKKK